MQHKKQFLDRGTKSNRVSHVSEAFPEIVRQLAKRHEISEKEVVERLRGKVVIPDEAE